MHAALACATTRVSCGCSSTASATGTRGSWPRRSPPSTSCPTGAPRSASVPGGPSRSMRRTASDSRPPASGSTCSTRPPAPSAACSTTARRTPTAPTSGRARRRLEPLPVQRHLPIWIGGNGERRTARIVARHGDGWNIPFVAADVLAHKRPRPGGPLRCGRPRPRRGADRRQRRRSPTTRRRWPPSSGPWPRSSGPAPWLAPASTRRRTPSGATWRLARHGSIRALQGAVGRRRPRSAPPRWPRCARPAPDGTRTAAGQEAAMSDQRIDELSGPRSWSRAAVSSVPTGRRWPARSASEAWRRPSPTTSRSCVNRWPSFPDGRSEVVLYTPEHDASFPDLGAGAPTGRRPVDRSHGRPGGPRTTSPTCWCSRTGARGGATISHPHGQIYAYGEVPAAPLTELRRTAGAIAPVRPS